MAKCKEEIVINASVEDVWNFTQDINRRQEWDFRIKEGCLIDAAVPFNGARFRTKGRFIRLFQLEMQYIMFEPNKRSAVKLIGCQGMPIIKGGGSWHYESTQNGSCLFTTNIQMMTRPTKLGKVIDTFFLQPFLVWMTKKSLQNLKLVIEKEQLRSLLLSENQI